MLNQHILELSEEIAVIEHFIQMVQSRMRIARLAGERPDLFETIQDELQLMR